MAITVKADFPQPLECLFQPKRWKVLYGGRGAGRSWGVARALLLIGAQKPIRVLCARELQNSIAESVHKLLTDQIANLGLPYNIEVQKIWSPNGTQFSFEGIKNNTSKIKSYEGIDYCWVEEANKVSRASWEILIPTIRKEVPPNWRELGMSRPDWQSEIWMTFNPELETDYTYKRFVLEANLDESFVIKMTWRDNPWFPDVLRKEMEDLRTRDYDAFLNVWEGFPRQILEGAVYARELRHAQEDGRILARRDGGVPWDRMTPVETFWDLGKRDLTAVWFAQVVAMQYRILRYYEGSGLEIQEHLQELQRFRYTLGTFHLPFDARAKRLGSKRTIEEQIRQAGHTVHIIPKLGISDGINAARSIFPLCWFDEERCADGLARLRHYRYKVTDGQLSKEPLHDDNSNGADAFRYLATELRPPRKGKISVIERLNNLTNAAAKRDPIEGGWLGR